MDNENANERQAPSRYAMDAISLLCLLFIVLSSPVMRRAQTTSSNLIEDNGSVIAHL